MAKYKTIVNNVNLWYGEEVIKVLNVGSTIEVEKIESYTDTMKRTFELATCKDGSVLIASFNGKPSIEAIKTKSKKKGE